MQDAFGVTAFVASVVQLSLSRSLSFARVTAEVTPRPRASSAPGAGRVERQALSTKANIAS